jgi:hypothetical protein
MVNLSTSNGDPKRWLFIDPKYLSVIRPYVCKGHSEIASSVAGNKAPEARREVSPARKRWVNGERQKSAVGAAQGPDRSTVLRSAIHHPKTYNGSYSMPCFFNNAMNSSSNVILR